MNGWYKKALFLVTLAVLGMSSASAQHLLFKTGPSTYGGAPNYPLIHGFESVEADTSFWGTYGTTPLDDADPNYLGIDSFVGFGGVPQEGQDAMWMDWALDTPNSWGGSAALQHFLPQELMDAGTYYDFSDFTHLNLWFNTLSPAAHSSGFRFKINEASDNTAAGQFEDWYAESRDMYQALPGWTMVTTPLDPIPGCCSTTGFNRPGWSGQTGNNALNLDKIAGFQLEFVSEVVAGDPTRTVTIVWDNFHVSGVRYNLLADFEGMPTSHSKQSNAGSYTLTNSTDAILGNNSLKVDYSIVGDQGWGGELDLYFRPEGGAANFGDMNARTGITVFYKVLTPSSTGMTFGLRVHETGGELWASERTDVLTDVSGNWRRYTATFKDMTIPSWCGCAQDGVLDQSAIAQVQFVLYTGQGNTTTGSILFDRMTGYGFQETDNTAPQAVTGLSVSQGDFQNIVSWIDVPGEEDETYRIYASETPITDVTAAGVALIAEVEGGVEAAVHPIFYPVRNNSLTYYYAIVPVDRVGNVGPATIHPSAVPNNAKGIATIHLGTPTGFAADGATGDWAGITPIRLEVGTLFGHSAGSIPPNNAADLSADAYLAMDSEALYFAFVVSDDVYDPVPDDETSDRWMYDGAELYIGLYDGRLGEHVGYENGAEPDYKFYMYKQDLRSDQLTSPVSLNGDGMYFFGPRGGGWVTEGKILLSAMKKADFDQFVPMSGIRVPLDIVFMDDDTAPGGRNRESILTYSNENNDNSWQSPRNWFYTWIGDAYATGVEAVSAEVPSEFALHQNYPNPFNPVTTFRYDVKATGRVSLKIFNILGQEVETLVDSDQTAGTYEVRFDASKLTSGVYVYQLRSGNFVQSRKMLLVR